MLVDLGRIAARRRKGAHAGARFHAVAARPLFLLKDGDSSINIEFE
jgi:hypothetical protein